MFGRFYEEFDVGAVYIHWPGKTITESDNNLFSLITMNHHPVHLDSNYAAQQQHGKILVVGTLVLSLVVGQSVRDVSGKAVANLNYESIDHLNPVFIGDTIYSKSTVITKEISKSNLRRGIVKVKTEAWNQDKKPVLVFQRSVLVPSSTV
jgi:acyl dehydratase